MKKFLLGLIAVFSIASASAQPTLVGVREASATEAAAGVRGDVFISPRRISSALGALGSLAGVNSVTSATGQSLTLATLDSGNIVLAPYNANSGDSGGYISMPTGGAVDGVYSHPLRWGGGNQWSFTVGRTANALLIAPFDKNHNFDLSYNPTNVVGDVAFGLGFEAAFKTGSGDLVTELYYHWDGIQAGATGARRPLSFGTHLGVQGDSKAAGYTDTSFHVEEFYISPSGSGTGSKGLNLQLSHAGTSTLAWDGNASFSGTTTLATADITNVSADSVEVVGAGGSGNQAPFSVLASGLGTGPNYVSMYVGKAATSYNAGQVQWEHNANGTSANNLYLGIAGVGNFFKLAGTGDVSALGTTEATTGGNGALKTDGGIYAAKRIYAVGGVIPRSTSVAYAASVTPNVDTTDVLNIGTLTGDITINAPSGTPSDGQRLLIRFAQDGTGGRAVTLNAAFVYTDDVTALLVPTAASKKWDMLFIYNSAASKYVASAINRGTP